MTCAAIAALAGAVTMHLPMAHLAIGMGKSPDVLVIAPSDEGAALVCYHNSADKTSNSATHDLQLGDLTIRVRIEVGPGEAEIITITPPAGYVAEPPDGAAVDGAEFQSLIMWMAS